VFYARAWKLLCRLFYGLGRDGFFHRRESGIGWGRKWERLRRVELRRRDLRRLGEPVLVFRLQRRQNQLSQQSQIADVAVVKSEWPGAECFQDPDDATSPTKRHRDHGSRPQLAAGLEIHPRIGFGVVAIEDLSGAEAGSRKCGIAIDARANVWPDGARCCAQNDFVVLREGDGQSVSPSDGRGALRHQLQDFIKNELFFGLEFCDGSFRIESVVAGCQ
jgi:hypothetical protein